MPYVYSEVFDLKPTSDGSEKVRHIFPRFYLYKTVSVGAFPDNSPAPKAFGAGENGFRMIFKSLLGTTGALSDRDGSAVPERDFGSFFSLRPSVETGYCQKKR